MSMSPRKKMAGGESGGNFGMTQLASAHTHPDHGISHAPMADGGRGAPPPIKHSPDLFPSQANADHGPHHVKS